MFNWQLNVRLIVTFCGVLTFKLWLLHADSAAFSRMHESVCVFKCNYHSKIVSSGSQELMIRLEKSREQRVQREEERCVSY